MPIYVARRLNATGLLVDPLPSLGPNDFIYNPSFKKERFQGEWLRTMQNITTGSNFTRMEHGIDPTGERGDYVGNWERLVNTSSWMCFKQAVHVSTFPIGVRFDTFGGMAHVCIGMASRTAQLVSCLTRH